MKRCLCIEYVNIQRVTGRGSGKKVLQVFPQKVESGKRETTLKIENKNTFQSQCFHHVNLYDEASSAKIQSKQISTREAISDVDFKLESITIHFVPCIPCTIHYHSTTSLHPICTSCPNHQLDLHKEPAGIQSPLTAISA